MAEQPATQRAGEEARCEQHRGVELLHRFIAFGEEGLGKIKGKRGVSIKVVIFDQIANLTDENGFQPAAHIGEAGWGRAEVSRWAVGGGCQVHVASQFRAGIDGSLTNTIAATRVLSSPRNGFSTTLSWADLLP
jgi:hypothetical protein